MWTVWYLPMIKLITRRKKYEYPFLYPWWWNHDHRTNQRHHETSDSSRGECWRETKRINGYSFSIIFNWVLFLKSVQSSSIYSERVNEKIEWIWTHKICWVGGSFAELRKTNFIRQLYVSKWRNRRVCETWFFCLLFASRQKVRKK